jgi:hypothetical protein
MKNKKETLEEASKKWFGKDEFYPDPKQGFIVGFELGAKWQQEQYVDFSKHNADKITTASTTSAKIENKTLWKEMYSEEDMVSFAEFVATYPDKNRNVNGEILHAKSKYDGAERTIDLLKQFKKK